MADLTLGFKDGEKCPRDCGGRIVVGEVGRNSGDDEARCDSCFWRSIDHANNDQLNAYMLKEFEIGQRCPRGCPGMITRRNYGGSGGGYYQCSECYWKSDE